MAGVEAEAEWRRWGGGREARRCELGARRLGSGRLVLFQEPPPLPCLLAPGASGRTHMGLAKNQSSYPAQPFHASSHTSTDLFALKKPEQINLLYQNRGTPLDDFPTFS